MQGKVTLTRYRRIKTKLRPEPFLQRNRTGVRRIIRLRAGTERLQVMRGRFRGTPGAERRRHEWKWLELQREIVRDIANKWEGKESDLT